MKRAVIFGLILCTVGTVYGQDVDNIGSDKLDFRTEQKSFTSVNKIGQKRKVVQVKTPLLTEELKRYLTHALGVQEPNDQSKIFSNPTVIGKKLKQQANLNALGVQAAQLQKLLKQDLSSESTD